MTRAEAGRYLAHRLGGVWEQGGDVLYGTLGEEVLMVRQVPKGWTVVGCGSPMTQETVEELAGAVERRRGWK